MQQRGHKRLAVELPAGADFGDSDGVGYVGLSAGAELAQMRLVREAVGFLDALDLFFVEIFANDLRQGR